MKPKIFRSSIILIFAGLFLGVFSACEKPEGEGGTSIITGKVRVKEIKSGLEYDAQEERVYIIYGNDITHSNDVRTNYDGTYRFSYLRKGEYTIYAYSEDTADISLSGIIPVKVSVEITKNNQIIEAEDIVIID